MRPVRVAPRTDRRRSRAPSSLKSLPSRQRPRYPIPADSPDGQTATGGNAREPPCGAAAPLSDTLDDVCVTRVVDHA